VSEAKPLIKDEMVAAGQAILYSEPEKQVRRKCIAVCTIYKAESLKMLSGPHRKAVEKQVGPDVDKQLESCVPHEADIEKIQ
jgi:hypothetical protein